MRNLSRVLLFIILILTLPGVVRAAMGIDEAEVDRAKVADAAKYYFYGWFLGEAVAGWDDIQVSLIPVYYFDGSLEGYCAILYWGKGRMPTFDDFRAWSKEVYDFNKDYNTDSVGDALSINDRLRYYEINKRAWGMEGGKIVFGDAYLIINRYGIGGPSGGQGLPLFFDKLFEVENTLTNKSGVSLKFDGLIMDGDEIASMFTDGQRRYVSTKGNVYDFDNFKKGANYPASRWREEYIPPLTWDGFDARIEDMKKQIPPARGGFIDPDFKNVFPEKYWPALTEFQAVPPDEAISAVIMYGDEGQERPAGVKVYEPVQIGILGGIGHVPVEYIVFAYEGDDPKVDAALRKLTTELNKEGYFDPTRIVNELETLRKINNGLYAYIVSGWIWDGPILAKYQGVPDRLLALPEHYRKIREEKEDVEGIAWATFSPGSGHVFYYAEFDSTSFLYLVEGKNMRMLGDSEIDGLIDEDADSYFNHYTLAPEAVKNSRYSWERVFKTDISKYKVDGYYYIKD